jgi:hypothetical protein
LASIDLAIWRGTCHRFGMAKMRTNQTSARSSHRQSRDGTCTRIDAEEAGAAKGLARHLPPFWHGEDAHESDPPPPSLSVPSLYSAAIADPERSRVSVSTIIMCTRVLYRRPKMRQSTGAKNVSRRPSAALKEIPLKETLLKTPIPLKETPIQHVLSHRAQGRASTSFSKSQSVIK